MKTKYKQLIKKLIGSIMLVISLSLIIAGLYYALGFVSHNNPYLIHKEFLYEGNEWHIDLAFDSKNGYFAQSPIDFNSEVILNGGDLDPNKTYDNYIRDKGCASILIKDTTYCYEPTSHAEVITIGNISGACIPLEIEGKYIIGSLSDKIIFPYEGDYEAFVIFDPFNETNNYISLGRVIHISSPESAATFATNNLVTGLSLIVVGMTLIQIWISLR